MKSDQYKGCGIYTTENRVSVWRDEAHVFDCQTQQQAEQVIDWLEMGQLCGELSIVQERSILQQIRVFSKLDAILEYTIPGPEGSVLYFWKIGHDEFVTRVNRAGGWSFFLPGRTTIVDYIDAEVLEHVNRDKL